MSEPFVINVADARALRFEGAGTYVPFEDPNERFPDFGINIHMLNPGEPSAKYHAESVQEDFLVLAGECTAILNGEERTLREWDFLHCPAGTEHVFPWRSDGFERTSWGGGIRTQNRLIIQSDPCCRLHHSPVAWRA
jgi:mannose-6-phosphate isomerase-like protein (cupin superfamily)